MLSIYTNKLEREAALHDDFRLEPSFDYGDDDEWDEDAENWTAEDEAAATEVVADVKDESTAYLEFLNEEVNYLRDPITEHETNKMNRRKSSAESRERWTRRSLEKRLSFWTLLWTS